MSGFQQALRAFREGTLSKEKLLTEVERQLAEREMDAVSLLKLLNEEHSRTRLPGNLHGVIAARILQWRDPPPPFKPMPMPSAQPPATSSRVLQGRFKLIESIGQGGSAVYKVIDCDRDGRAVFMT